MKLDKIQKLANQFLILATKEELPKNSKDLNEILKNIDSLETFSARKEYAEKNLNHLSSGSSRIIYSFDDKVIKLAKNEKGIAQNKVEAEPEMKCKYINGADKISKDGNWIIAKKLDKLTEKEFEKEVGFPFMEFGEALDYLMRNISGDKKMSKPKNYDKIAKMKMFKEIGKRAKKFSLLPGDLGRPSSWGQLNNYPILADAGLTRKIYDEYYDDGGSSSKEESETD